MYHRQNSLDPKFPFCHDRVRRFGRSVGIVRLRTKGHGVCFWVRRLHSFSNICHSVVDIRQWTAWNDNEHNLNVIVHYMQECSTHKHVPQSVEEWQLCENLLIKNALFSMLRSSLRLLWRMPSSEMWCLVAVVRTGGSEERNPSIIRVKNLQCASLASYCSRRS
jgi:hypothetical protein